ncbi:MAG: AAA family ATPase [Lachnospiraceae bacterium]|nr:AAA family ATPase [Lachnospiraceae bacterium]
MNIQQAKDYIKQTVSLYLTKGEFGEYVIPVVRQRPVFLLGAPGVGKTAVMEQIAQELGIALVSYSMTHHTRQSAIGLPFIKHEEYNGLEYDVTEYTMSEIIASIYETMKETGIKEGILFLDEINCVSETLAPSMLQFLQYKVFGRHQVPEGWVIVTAGNPPEFNKAVREFDVAVMDRLKIMNVEADYRVWKEYAFENSVHPAIISFLDLKHEYFYLIENTVNGRSYVTARGWEDLSEILKLYEDSEMPVDDTLIDQYIRNDTVVKEFAAYYELYNKYKRDYNVAGILTGEAGDEVISRASAASFDERLSLLSMLMDRVIADVRQDLNDADHLKELNPLLKQLKAKSLPAPGLNGTGDSADNDVLAAMLDITDKLRGDLKALKKASALSRENERIKRSCIKFFEEAYKEGLKADDPFEAARERYNSLIASVKEDSLRIRDEMSNLFDFASKAYKDGNEMLILVTEMTVNPYTSKFIARHGCDAYMKYKDEMMIDERNTALKEEIEQLVGEI